MGLGFVCGIMNSCGHVDTYPPTHILPTPTQLYSISFIIVTIAVYAILTIHIAE